MEVLAALVFMAATAESHQAPIWYCACVLVVVGFAAAATLLTSWSVHKASKYEKERDTVSKQYARLLENLDAAHVVLERMVVYADTSDVLDTFAAKHEELLGLTDSIQAQLRACGLHQVEDRARPAEAIPWWGIAVKATILLLCLLVLAYLWAVTRANMAHLGTPDSGAFVRLPPTYVLVTAAASVLIALFTANALIDMYGERARYQPPACGLRR
jgi:hypothetical protein